MAVYHGAMAHHGLKYTVFETEWGWFGLCALGEAIVRTVLPGELDVVRAELATAAQYEPGLLEAVAELVKDYYRGREVDFGGLAVQEPEGFAGAVVRACRAVTFGRTASYAELAAAAGRPGAARAAGSVMARNAIPLIVPCHRILRRDGQMGGFSAAGGVAVKKMMLRLEKSGLQK